jgi:hypothetical protein
MILIVLMKARATGRTAYADCHPTVAMMVTKTCSLIVNGPGFKRTPNIEILGTTAAQRRPMGNDKSWATIPVMLTEGYRKKKNWFKPGMMITQKKPSL